MDSRSVQQKRISRTPNFVTHNLVSFKKFALLYIRIGAVRQINILTQSRLNNTSVQEPKCVLGAKISANMNEKN
jgi:hypothetical protein